jgi:Flagellar hook-length control protein FliK
MPISVNPILPVIAAQPVAPELVLQPGTVVDAEVLKLLSDNLVRIAISSLSIDVLSEVPLFVGQTLQLAVTQTEGGIRLAIVGQGAAAGPSLDSITLAPEAPVGAVASPPLSAAPSVNTLTPLERAAVSAAAASAVTQQGSQAQLFANLGVATGLNGLPEKLQAAVMQVLAQRTSLDQNLTGNDVKTAFQKSGLFLEASLASGTALPTAGMLDLKAALIVLRQTLLSSLGAGAGPAAAASATVQPGSSATMAQPGASAAAGASPADTAAPPPAAPASTLAPSLSAEGDMREILLPQARVPVADDSQNPGPTVRIVLPETLLNIEPRTFAAGAAINLLQEALQEIPQGSGGASPATATPKDGGGDDITVHTNTPPPPFRGALPSAQPVAAPSIGSSAPLATSAHHLLGDTDAAMARQTLLQVASLPDRVDVPGVRMDPVTPRWSFEIPFTTPLGTAMAQFEISRDGAGNEVEAGKRVWRARFSLDVEPAGPVHALVSLSGERTSVRMWAERPATAAQLRAGAAQLGQALSRAELLPGDIVVRDGMPPQPAPARAGHFLDRAL